MKPKKTIDAVKMSRTWKARVSRKIAGMTPAEELAFFNSHQGIKQPEKLHAKAA